MENIWVPDSYQEGEEETDPVFAAYYKAWKNILSEKLLACLDTKDGAASRRLAPQDIDETDETQQESLSETDISETQQES